MASKQIETTATGYNLVDERQFVTKSAIIGGCLGGGATLLVGGSLTLQVVLAPVFAVSIGVGLYWLLCTLATLVTGEAHDSVITTREVPRSNGPRRAADE